MLVRVVFSGVTGVSAVIAYLRAERLAGDVHDNIVNNFKFTIHDRKATAMDELRHDLPEILPEPHDWPARRRQDGWWYLRYGSTERPLHRIAFWLYNDGQLEWNCHHCGAPVRWGGIGVDQLQVDHADGNKNNCSKENLVPSCRGCNRRKGSGQL